MERIKDETMPNRGSMVVDGHSDIPTDVFIRRMNGERNVLDRCHAPRLHSGGMNIQVMGIYVETRYKPDRVLEMALRQLEAFLEDIETSSEFMLIKSKHDLDETINRNKIGVILDLEGAEPIESGIELLYLFYRLGIRIVGITWNNRNALADGIDEIESRGGLTRYGREVLKEFFKLNIIPDVSHMAPAGVQDVLELSTGHVIASHSGAKSVYNHPRNLCDDHIKRIAKTGGLIGVPAFPYIIGPPVPTIDTVIDHIEYLVNLIGEEHVAVGADFIDFFENLICEGKIGKEWIVPKEENIKGFSSAKHIQNLKKALVSRNFSTSIVSGVIGDNFFRFFKNALPS